MKLSLNWIGDYIKLKVNPKELGARLSETLAEVSAIEKVGPDTVLEIENKALTHRPDCFSQKGLAREVAAATNTDFVDKKYPEVPEAGNNRIPLEVTVECPQLCPRYTTLVIDNVEVKTSPKWMQERLLSAGMRPINNLVDITNYVMLEIGQPLHAFDYTKLGNNHLIVREATNGEQVQTLDGTSRELQEGMVVIADPHHILAVAGVMGGADSEIGPETRTVVIESANFEMYGIRKTSSKLGLRSEASTRFEKGLDPNLTEEGLRVAADLILQLCPKAKVASEVKDYYPGRGSQKDLPISVIEIDPETISKKIGQPIESDQGKKIFEALGLVTWVKGNTWIVDIPSFRRDLTSREDLVEEIARIYGYSNLTPRLPERDLTPPTINKGVLFTRGVKRGLASLGFNEVYNYSFVSQDFLDQAGYPQDGYPKLINPISPDLRCLRPSLLPQLLLNAKENRKHFPALAIFELGKTFIKKGTELPEEISTVSGLITGEEKSFLEAKGLVEALLSKIGITKTIWELGEEEIPFYQPNRWAHIKSGGTVIGKCGQASYALTKLLEIPATTFVFELPLTTLIKTARPVSYKIPAKYPPLIEDISLLVDTDAPAGNISKEVETVSTPELVVEAIIKGVYQGDNLEPGKKSVTMQITYTCPTHTLSDAEVSQARERISKTLENNLKGKIRKN